MNAEQDIRPVVYADVRHLIYNGDLLLCRPTAISSQLIASGGRSEYSHAAVAARWGKVLMCMEMSYSGGRAVTLSSRVEKYPGQWDVYETNANHTRGFKRNEMVEEMIRAMGTCYGWGNFLRLCIRKLPVLRWIIKPSTDDCVNSRWWVCSEVVSRSCRLAGADPVLNLSDSETEPGDLARSPFFKYKFTLFNSQEEIDVFRKEKEVP